MYKTANILESRAYRLSQQQHLTSDVFIRKKNKNLEFEKKLLIILASKNIIVLPNKELQTGKHTLSLITNMCVLTQRFRGVKSKIKLSRHNIRKLGIQGHLVGLKKQSW